MNKEFKKLQADKYQTQQAKQIKQKILLSCQERKDPSERANVTARLNRKFMK